MITFDPLRADDLPLLKEWLGREHVRRWWRDYGQSLGDAEDALAGRDPAQYFLIVVDGRPVGMIETYLVAAGVYFVICFALSMLVRQLQRRIAIIR